MRRPRPALQPDRSWADLRSGNLDRLLNDGIERLGSARVSLQNPAIDLRPALVGHVYVPDVAITDLGFEPGRNAAGSCHLAAEVVSPTSTPARKRG